MNLLKMLAVATAVGAWCVIVFGGFTTATGSGLGCREAITCGENPLGPEAAQIETSHRIVAWTEGFLVLAMFILVAMRFRPWKPVWRLTTLAFVLIIAQSLLGMISVTVGWAPGEYRDLYPRLVTLHLAVATAFLAVVVFNAATVFHGPPPGALSEAPAPESGEPTASPPSPPSASPGR